MRLNRYIPLMTLPVMLWACSEQVKPGRTTDRQAGIYPDYAGITVPCNIAAPNFNITDSGVWAAGISYGDNIVWVKARGEDRNIDIPARKWREIAREAKGDSVTVTLCRKDSDGWTAYRPWSIHISADSIDRTLVYRLIPPLYGTWREIGIYQRDLGSYDERPVYRNTAYHGNCVNCHSFCARQPDNMLLHLRGPGGGTYLKRGSERQRLDTKTDSTISNFTYPYWHPSGRYVAFSVNDIFQVFHTSDPDRTEVIDDASDIVVYDIERGTCFSSPALKTDTHLETFPAFSADGRKLYYCTAEKPDTLPEEYRKVKYALCVIDFDPETGRFGEKPDTIYGGRSADADPTADAGTMMIPRPSPDGRWIVATHGDYGNFLIWHKEADLWLYDTQSGVWREMTEANSDDVESYHCWSGNSRWIVYSSRRDDGLYTRPYIVHIDAEGNLSKPFMLPQRNPMKHYSDRMESYNIPELVDGPVELDTRQVVDWIGEPMKKVEYENR